MQRYVCNRNMQANVATSIGRSVVLLFLLCRFVEPVCAQDASSDESVIQEYRLKIEQLEKEAERMRSFTAHKPNFVHIYTVNPSDDSETQPSKDSNVIFQISFKQDLWAIDYGRLYFAYSQKSFWRMYNIENSRPFRETNHNPEIFFRTRGFDLWGGTSFDFGIEHESNGAEEPSSRSWNRIYGTPSHSHDFENGIHFNGQLKLWHRIPEKKKETPDDPRGDENPDIGEYYGNKELHLGLNWRKFTLSFMLRHSFLSGRGAILIDLAIPTYLPSGMYWHFRFFDGYGESLIDYNRKITRYGIGFLFSQ